jgi:hypothetical protein
VIVVPELIMQRIKQLDPELHRQVVAEMSFRPITDNPAALQRIFFAVRIICAFSLIFDQVSKYFAAQFIYSEFENKKIAGKFSNGKTETLYGPWIL